MAHPAGDDNDVLRRDKILRAAVAEFSAKGLAGVRIDQIAKRAECNKALIYYYFGNKEGLYDAVFQHLIDRNSEIWVDTKNLGLSEFLARSETAHRDPERLTWTRLLAMEGLADEGPGTATRERERIRVWNKLVRIAMRSQATGELDGDLDAEMTVLMFVMFEMGARIMPQLTRMITGSSPGDAEFADRMQAYIEDVLRKLGPGGNPDA